MRTFAQQPVEPPLSSAQLRDLVLQAADKINQLEKEGAAAAEYITALKKLGEGSAKEIAKLEARDIDRQNEIVGLRSSLAIMQGALATSEQATANATKEAARQKSRANRWKWLARIGTVAGAIAGAGAVILLKR